MRLVLSPIVFVFEKRQRNIIHKRYPDLYAAKPIECLYIQDIYPYGDAELAFVLNRPKAGGNMPCSSITTRRCSMPMVAPVAGKLCAAERPIRLSERPPLRPMWDLLPPGGQGLAPLSGSDGA